MQEKQLTYKHILISGSPYEAGVQLGKSIKEDKSFIDFMTTPFMGGHELSNEMISKAVEQFETFCPGINDEIRGFADAVSVDWKKIVYYSAYMQINGCNCSHIAITPEFSKDGHCYLARNYEYSWDNKPFLITSKVDGQFSQIGFACQLFGRFDGMNEHGLCVTTSAGVINPPYNKSGFVFPVVVRAILNKCRTVDEAVAFYKTIPFADYRNFIITDSNGDAALIEAETNICDIKRAGRKEKEKFLFTTNHYNSIALKDKYKVFNHSKTRYNAIQKILEKKICVTKNDLKNLLIAPLPEGLCCHYYEDGMGTMWSFIMDSSEKKIDLCFGTPDKNEWKVFTLNSFDKSEYNSTLYNERAPDDFWT